MADDVKPTGSKSDKWIFWHAELEQARKVKGYHQWQTRAKKIVERYRDQRGDPADYQDAASVDTAKFNILWSNVQTLLPALVGKTPKPVVQRRYLDSDEVGRVATVILERALMYELDEGHYFAALRRAVLDRLLPGRGVNWVRYEPRFTAMPQKTQEVTEEAEAPKPAEPAASEGGEVAEEVASESAPVDYIDWHDFLTSPARVWDEVWWIAKRVYMTRRELVKRFPKYGAKIPLDFSPAETGQMQPGASAPPGEQQKRAKIWEIWNKRDRKVIWLSEGFSDDILDEKDDPLKLEGFYPVPRPLSATLTNDSLIPVPDYYEYQDQARELDDLTSRIAALTKAIKVAGIYDSSVDELKRMFEEGFENRLVPCDNMAEFSSKAGANGMGHIWLLPIVDMARTLNELYTAREQVKQSLYEITGIADIVRGSGEAGPAKTATEQRIKGQFASMRLNDMQSEVSRFALDTLNIMGEVIAEHFDPMTLFLVSGYEQWARDQWWDDFKPPEPPPNPMMGHNGGPPLDQPPGAVPPAPVQGAPGSAVAMPPAGPPPMSPEQQLAIAEQQFRQKSADMFRKAVALLKNEKLRGFRIEIETDSLIEADKQETQRARSEFLAAVGQFLQQAVPLGQALPEFMPLLGKMLLFGVRGFSASRDLESAFEQMIEQLQQAAKNPPPKPPSPEEIKAQAEQQKQQMESQRMQMQAQIDQQKAQQDVALQQQKAQMEIEREQMKLQIEREKLELQRQKMALDMQAAQQKMAIDTQAAERDAAIDTMAATRDAQIAERAAEREETAAVAQAERDEAAGEQQFELQQKTAKLKAQQAAKPKKEAA